MFQLAVIGNSAALNYFDIYSKQVWIILNLLMDMQPLIRGQPWWSKHNTGIKTQHTHIYIYERQPRLQTVCNVLTWIWIWRSYFWNGKQNVLYIQNRHDIMEDSVSTETAELGGQSGGLAHTSSILQRPHVEQKMMSRSNWMTPIDR